MRKGMRNGLTMLLLLALFAGLGMVARKNMQAKEDLAAYAEAEKIAKEPDVPLTELPEEAPAEKPEELSYVWREAPVVDDPYMDVLRETDLAALREVNEDVIGWIVIPDTKLEYPLMYSGDNAFYLNHTWKKEASSAGSIFLEQYNSPELSDFNTILYGHRMINGSMFASLKYYNSQEHWEKHPYVYLLDGAGAHRYEIFSAYEASVVGRTYQLGFADDVEKQTFLDSCVGWSVIDTGVVPTINDRILTLSTCTGKGYDTRWVVQARLAADTATQE